MVCHRPNSSDHDGGEGEVSVDLQAGDLVQVVEAVPVFVNLHPIHDDPERLVITGDGHIKGLSFAERHGSSSLLGAPSLSLLGVPDHGVLREARVIMQRNPRRVAQIHMEPVCILFHSSLDGNGPTWHQSPTDGTLVRDSRHG